VAAAATRQARAANDARPIAAVSPVPPTDQADASGEKHASDLVVSSSAHTPPELSQIEATARGTAPPAETPNAGKSNDAASTMQQSLKVAALPDAAMSANEPRNPAAKPPANISEPSASELRAKRRAQARLRARRLFAARARAARLAQTAPQSLFNTATTFSTATQVNSATQLNPTPAFGSQAGTP